MLSLQTMTNVFSLAVLLNIMSCAVSDWEHALNINDRDLQSLPRQQATPSGRWDGSQDLEPQLAGKGILLFEDFEAPNYNENWPVYWGKPVGAGTVSGPQKYVFAGERSAYTESHKGSHKSSGAGEYVPNTPLEVAYVRLHLRLPDDFSIGRTRQLKLFSIRAGAGMEDTYGGAGNRPTGNDKFSATLAIDNWNEIHVYYYHPGQQGRYGEKAYCDKLFCSARIEPGRWQCLELMVKANTPGSKDGQIRVWQDDHQIIGVTKIRFRDDSAVKIRRFAVVNYWGGSLRSDTSPEDQRIYIDNYVVSGEPIGCYSAATDSND